MLINKHKQAQRRDIEDNLVKQWMNEDFEWSRSNSQADTNNAGDYRNPSFIYEESASHREITGDFGQPIPDYQLTQPDLDTNSRQSSPFSTRSLSLPPTSHSSSNLPMTIGRPQIRTSWDA
ncbi:putative cell wall protein DAN4-like [Scophthalmus maximus]|nr:putative cell wall protein DAN4-like [Scophthalmus maximus]